MKILIAVLFSSLIKVSTGTYALCDESFCKGWLGDNVCRTLPDNCLIQNMTHNGITLLHPGPCNCCDYCVANLNEADMCTIGDLASTLPRAICGDGLRCTSEDVGICRRINDTICTMEQNNYDARRMAGNLGHLELRPICNRRGNYGPFKCIPGEICYCVSEDGKRIFGEMPFSLTATFEMTCRCSRNYETSSAFIGTILHPNQHLRCRSTGDYDPLQCLDDECMCVHVTAGTPAMGNYRPVNETMISNETLPCFDHSVHTIGRFRRDCEEKYIKIVEEVLELQSTGTTVLGYTFPNCQLDGYYAPVQYNETFKYCVDPTGNILEDFIVDINNILAEDMNCKCARSRSIVTGDQPDCLENGNYNPVQCRRGLCRCVDVNGNQVVQEDQEEPEVDITDIDRLPCVLDDGLSTTTIITTSEAEVDENYDALNDGLPTTTISTTSETEVDEDYTA